MRYIPLRLAVHEVDHAASRPALYHTTSAHSAVSILEERELRGGNFQYFVSLSEIPFTAPGETSANQVIVVFDRSALAPSLLQVEYDEEWFSQHQEEGEYIAGEGWREWVHELLEDCPEDDFGIDEDCEEEAYYEGALQSFLYKEDEREWIGAGPIRFDPSVVQALLVVDERVDTDRLRELVQDLGYDVPVLDS